MHASQLLQIALRAELERQDALSETDKYLDELVAEVGEPDEPAQSQAGNTERLLRSCNSTCSSSRNKPGEGSIPTSSPTWRRKRSIIVGSDLTECTTTILTTPNDDADLIAPDTQFQYGGAQWQVARGIAEIASGESWTELIDRIYVEPCGLESLVYASGVQALVGFPEPPAWFDGDPASVPETANPNIEGGAFINTADYGALLQMHLNGGQCPGGRVLRQESLDIMHADRIGTVYEGATPETGQGYGMGWWRDSGEIVDPGAFGARAWINSDAGYAACWVIETRSLPRSSMRQSCIVLSTKRPRTRRSQRSER